MRLEAELERRAARAIHAALGVEARADVRRAQDAKFGDYQINGVLPLAKQLKKPPRELAQAVLDALEKVGIHKAEIAGPGFINLTLDASWVAARIQDALSDRERDGVPKAEKAQRVVVDFSAPNVAKQMHVGHLRSTILGDALVRVLRLVGHEVVGDNHIGDWGTQFGLLIAGLRAQGRTHQGRALTIAELESVYKEATSKAKADATFAEHARAELAKLQAGDGENRALWELFVAATRRELDAVYERLAVRFDMWKGESAYNDQLPGVVDELLRRGIAREDQGAICVFFDDDPELAKLKTPWIVRKQDGAFLYSTTDVATLLERVNQMRAERIIYVTDARQSLHFQQLFAVGRKLGVTAQLEHVAFGSILGADGKPLKTRDGSAMPLVELLDEAEARAKARMQEEGLHVAPADLARVARAVGIGAVKYADLKQNRVSDYKFEWEKLISFKGNAGPYLQYAFARIASIFRKLELDIDGFDASAPPTIEAPEERALAVALLRFADEVHRSAADACPHYIAEHIYEVARVFSGFYEACPIAGAATPQVRESRLALAQLAARQIRRGLNVLGIDTVDRM